MSDGSTDAATVNADRLQLPLAVDDAHQDLDASVDSVVVRR